MVQIELDSRLACAIGGKWGERVVLTHRHVPQLASTVPPEETKIKRGGSVLRLSLPVA